MVYLKNILVIVLIFSGTFISCNESENSDNTFQPEKTNVKPLNNRRIGLDLLNLTETNSFNDNLAFAKQLNINFIALHLNWTSIETSANSFIDPEGTIKALNNVAKANHLKFSLTIRPIDLSGKTVPEDLEMTRFNDSIMVNRFKTLIDFIFAQIDTNILLNFQIGNEIDGYNISNENPEFWGDYGTFLKEISTYIYSKNKNIKVGFTGTLPGLIHQSTLFNNLIENVDILGVTYYPLNAEFKVKNKNSVLEDFKNITDNFPAKPIYFQEVGLPSGSENNSSEEIQSEFYKEIFRAWDTYDSQIKTINFVRLNDVSKTEANNLAIPYGITNKSFIEYLRTLGIRTFEKKGINKAAFNTLVSEINKRK